MEDTINTTFDEYAIAIDGDCLTQDYDAADEYVHQLEEIDYKETDILFE